MKWLMIAAIRGYQRWIVPRIPPNVCGMQPSCSQYGLEAIRRYGTKEGLRLLEARLEKCKTDGAAAKQTGTAALDPVP